MKRYWATCGDMVFVGALFFFGTAIGVSVFTAPFRNQLGSDSLMVLNIFSLGCSVIAACLIAAGAGWIKALEIARSTYVPLVILMMGSAFFWTFYIMGNAGMLLPGLVVTGLIVAFILWRSYWLGKINDMWDVQPHSF